MLLALTTAQQNKIPIPKMQLRHLFKKSSHKRQWDENGSGNRQNLYDLIHSKADFGKSCSPLSTSRKLSTAILGLESANIFLLKIK